MRTILSIAFVEARMSLRGWRFWLLLSLTLGVSLFARYDYILFTEQGYYLHPGYSFIHPSMALMMCVFLVGAALIALDICGRLQRTRMDLIIHPMPVHPFSLAVGRFLAVLLILAPVSALGYFSLGFWQYLYGNSLSVWQPFAMAWLLLTGPVIPLIAALAVAVRSLIKYDFAALLMFPAIASVLAWFGLETGLMLDPLMVWTELANSSPTLGALITVQHYLAPLLSHAALCVALLVTVPLYYRRMEPQRPLLPGNRSLRWISFPVFRRWVRNVRFERHLGWGFYAVLIIGLSTAASAGWSAYHSKENTRLMEAQDLAELIRRQDELRPSPIRLERATAQVTPSAAYDYVAIRTQLELIAEEEIDQFILEIASRYEIDAIETSGVTLPYERWGDALSVQLPTLVAEGDAFTLSLEYRGTPEKLHPRYSALDDRWLPRPWTRERTEQRWTQTREHFFDAEITLHLLPDQNVAFPGERISVDNADSGRIERWRTGHPVNTVHIHWGRYQSIDLDNPIARIRFYHLEGHDYQAAVYLEEIRDQVDVVREHLGPLPFPQLTIIETPYRQPGSLFAFFHRPAFVAAIQQTPMPGPGMGPGGGPRGQTGGAQRQVAVLAPTHDVPLLGDRMPGLLYTPENHLMYLHSGVWLLDRLDLDPRSVFFFQQLRPVLERISNTFYNSLIESYYRETINPTGEYAFWLREHLVRYVHKLLESNPWRQRSQLRYDIGHRSDLPLSVAQNATLLDLHRNAYRALESVRGEAMFRMIHHLIGDESWWALNRSLFEEMRFQPLTAIDFVRLAEEISGEDLEWFYEQWIEGTALPEYVITLAEARLVEIVERMSIEYDVIIRVRNRGTGRMKVPIYLETERDYVIRDLWLDENDEQTLRLTVPHRPVFATVDPHHWVLQVPPINERNRRRIRSEARVFIIGDQRAAALR